MKSTIVYCWLALFVTAPFMQGAQVPQPQNAASKASIQGIVTKAGAGQPLKGVRISFRSLDGSQNPFGNVRTPVTTDATGRFLVTGVDPGQYRISAERDDVRIRSVERAGNVERFVIHLGHKEDLGIRPGVSIFC